MSAPISPAPDHRRRVAILGSTGSIGTSTLDVLALHPDRFEVFALCAATQGERLLEQCQRHRPRFAVLHDAIRACELSRQCREHGLPTEVLDGPQALLDIATHEDVDIVMAAIVGVAGLGSCLAAARAGKRLLLANKEALVVGGALFLDAVRTGGAQLLPIDSEHSAIFQSLPADRTLWASQIQKILLTASGGPFRQRDPATFAQITPAEACAHPNWVMGKKITVDSATMMNKALEVIEACYLFSVAPSQIEVLIHPQSVIHSMVQFVDHCVLAQLGTPDMKAPIAYGLSWPDRMASGAAALDFGQIASLHFETLDSPLHRARFPCLPLAWQALQGPAGSTAILNAANEVAVEAFLSGQLRFDQIFAVNAETMHTVAPWNPSSLDDLVALDALARTQARDWIARHGRLCA
ncbi:1-deoxy-D-xylulose-5-phosphate reductoisomerase [Candidatus Symbiobacter mobilis]|uniref:1-deoxy-D-xylulose 5-phosphate reductoisomerase n=1 Tax=Candidatus Symbiobacter mobilis CR TaxID=946483 RepID=U5N3U9_9BURK|nr:1-deoxy-D-xylulose-5-phosphate reductoisomerase [Candidatus Symbiobacter mobilis]AGX86166.1 1-deoxy-D-xylulose-5-phosphate reductoisomerase [Candidatus Symbiobacter mobilis CR]